MPVGVAWTQFYCQVVLSAELACQVAVLVPAQAAEQSSLLLPCRDQQPMCLLWMHWPWQVEAESPDHRIPALAAQMPGLAVQPKPRPHP